MSRTVRLGPGIVTILNSKGEVIRQANVESFEMSVQEQADGTAVGSFLPAEITIPLTQVDYYTRLQDAAHRETLQAPRKRPAWKTPYGPQRR